MQQHQRATGSMPTTLVPTNRWGRMAHAQVCLDVRVVELRDEGVRPVLGCVRLRGQRRQCGMWVCMRV